MLTAIEKRQLADSLNPFVGALSGQNLKGLSETELEEITTMAQERYKAKQVFRKMPGETSETINSEIHLFVWVITRIWNWMLTCNSSINSNPMIIIAI